MIVANKLDQCPIVTDYRIFDFWYAFTLHNFVTIILNEIQISCQKTNVKETL